MILFFRKIRQKLLIENNSGKYLKYALGEIFLVMIGILLAFQVNSWNQERLNRLEEKTVLTNLHHEFLENQKALKNAISINSNALNANITLGSLMGEERSIIEKHNLDSLFYHSLPAVEYLPSDHAISNIIQGGKENLITNPKINSLLARWQTAVEHIKKRDNYQDNWTINIELIFLLKFISFKEMDSYGSHPAWLKPSSLKKDYYPLFQELEFENILDNAVYLQTKTLERLNEADALMTQIIKITESYSND